MFVGFGKQIGNKPVQTTLFARFTEITESMRSIRRYTHTAYCRIL